MVQEVVKLLCMYALIIFLENIRFLKKIHPLIWCECTCFKIIAGISKAVMKAGLFDKNKMLNKMADYESLFELLLATPLK